MTTRTTVELEKIGLLLDGRHENPFELLGPTRSWPPAAGHWRCGRFCPARRRPGSSTRSTTRPQPMRRIHPAGLYEAICPMSGRPDDTHYQLRVADERGGETIDARSLCLSAAAHRVRPVPAGRGQALDQLPEARRAVAHDRRRRGRELRRLGPQRHGRQRRRRLQRVGSPPPPDAQAHSQRHLGAVRARASAAGAIYKYHIRHRDESFEKVRSLRLRRRGAAAHRLEGGRPGPLRSGTTPSGWPTASAPTRSTRPMSIYEVHLGSWKRPGDDPTRWLDLSRAGPPTGRLLPRRWATRTWS